jgi:hypothetical protein
MTAAMFGVICALPVYCAVPGGNSVRLESLTYKKNTSGSKA